VYIRYLRKWTDEKKCRGGRSDACGRDILCENALTERKVFSPQSRLSISLSLSLSVKIPFLSRPPRLRRPYPQSVDFDKGFKFQGEKRRKIRDSRDGVT